MYRRVKFYFEYLNLNINFDNEIFYIIKEIIIINKENVSIFRFFYIFLYMCRV